MRVIQHGSSAHDFGEYIFRACGPDEGFGAFVVLVDEIVQSLNEFKHATEHTAPEPIFGKVSKEAFHHVEPGRACWSEMDMEAGMPF